jgi:hypothetical protein
MQGLKTIDMEFLNHSVGINWKASPNDNQRFNVSIEFDSVKNNKALLRRLELLLSSENSWLVPVLGCQHEYILEGEECEMSGERFTHGHRTRAHVTADLADGTIKRKASRDSSPVRGLTRE